MTGKEPEKRARLWTCTGNPIREWRQFFDTVLSVKCTWAVGQVEIAPTTGHVHLQYCVYFEHPKTLKWMINNIHGGDTYKISVGTALQNRVYCTKDESRHPGDQEDYGPWEYGDMPKQGERTDIQSIVQSITSGQYRSYVQFARANPAAILRMDRGIQALFEVRPPPPRCVTKCIYMWGPAGIGKSTGWKRAGIPEDQYYQPGYEVISRTLNFSGYDMEPLVVVDEIDGIPMSRNWWLQFAEEVPVRLPVKGSKPVFWNSKFIIVTSNRPPPGIFLDDGAWTRRWRVRAVVTRRDVELVYREVAGDITRDFCAASVTAPVHVAEPSAQADGIEVPISGTG